MGSVLDRRDAGRTTCRTRKAVALMLINQRRMNAERFHTDLIPTRAEILCGWSGSRDRERCAAVNTTPCQNEEKVGADVRW